MYVEEAVFAAIFRINFGQRFAQRHQSTIVDQEEERFGGSNFHAIADDGNELGHGELLWHQELALLQMRQFGFFAVALNNDLQKNGGKREGNLLKIT